MDSNLLLNVPNVARLAEKLSDELLVGLRSTVGDLLELRANLPRNGLLRLKFLRSLHSVLVEVERVLGLEDGVLVWDYWELDLLDLQLWRRFLFRLFLSGSILLYAQLHSKGFFVGNQMLSELLLGLFDALPDRAVRAAHLDSLIIGMPL